MFQGSTYTEFHTNLRQFPFDDNSSLLSDSNSYKINVDTFTKKINLQSKIDKIESMDYLPIKGSKIIQRNFYSKIDYLFEHYMSQLCFARPSHYCEIIYEFVGIYLAGP